MKRPFILFSIVFLSGLSVSGQCNLGLVPSVSPSNECNPCNGNANINPTSGTPPYTYSWSNGMTDAFIDSLCAGTYWVIVTDAMACADTDTVVVNNTNTLSASASQTSPILCNGDSNAAVTVNITGGTGPYQVNWTTGDTTIGVSGLPAGCYTVVVTESSGCTASSTVCIFQPGPLSLNAFANNDYCVPCNGSAAAIGGGGTAPYTYTWSTSATGQTISGLCAGTYTVVLTDNNGCIQTASVTVNNDPLFAITLNLDLPASCWSCCDGALSVTTTNGNPPYSYLWTPGSITTPSATGLCTGMYTICVTDGGGCTVCDSIYVPSPVGMEELQVHSFGEGLIEFSTQKKIASFSLSDISGRVVFEQSGLAPGKHCLSTGRLPAAVYILHLRSEDELVRLPLLQSR